MALPYSGLAAGMNAAADAAKRLGDSLQGAQGLAGQVIPLLEKLKELWLAEKNDPLRIDPQAEAQLIRYIKDFGGKAAAEIDFNALKHAVQTGADLGGSDAASVPVLENHPLVQATVNATSGVIRGHFEDFRRELANENKVAEDKRQTAQSEQVNAIVQMMQDFITNKYGGAARERSFGNFNLYQQELSSLSAADPQVLAYLQQITQLLGSGPPPRTAPGQGGRGFGGGSSGRGSGTLKSDSSLSTMIARGIFQ